MHIDYAKYKGKNVATSIQIELKRKTIIFT